MFYKAVSILGPRMQSHLAETELWRFLFIHIETHILILEQISPAGPSLRPPPVCCFRVLSPTRTPQGSKHLPLTKSLFV